MSGHIDGVPPRLVGIRDPLADYRKAVESKIAVCRSLGEAPSAYLLQQLAELDALDGVAEKPAPEPAFERKDVEPPAETAVPRGPGRPRKPTDADSGAGS